MSIVINLIKYHCFFIISQNLVDNNTFKVVKYKIIQNKSIAARSTMANASDSDSEDWGFESLRVDQKQKAGGACFFVFKKGRETRFRILKPTADEIRENSLEKFFIMLRQ